MELRTVPSRGHTISYEEHGLTSAPPVLLVPGLGSPAREWTDRGYIEPLAQRYRVLAVDPLGHGNSDVPDDPGQYLLPDVAEDVVAVMDAAGVDRAVVWGYSRGSSLAVIAAVEHPDRVVALVVGGFFPTTGEPSFDASPAEQAMLDGDWQRAFEAWAAAGMDLSRDDRDYMVKYSHPQGVAASMLGASRSHYRPDITRISTPVLAYYGAEDMQDPRTAEIAADLGVEPIALPGQHDHAEAFNDSEAVLPIVVDYVDRTLNMR